MHKDYSIYQIVAKDIDTKYYFDVFDSEDDAKAIVEMLNNDENNPNLWFGYITIPVHSYQTNTIKDYYEDKLDNLSTHLKEDFS